jgi:hypothetical protein
MSDFGHWLAGFIDGEGCFYITTNKNQPGWCRPKFSLGLRADDRSTLESVRSMLDGIGTIYEYAPSVGSRKVHWSISSQADCEALCSLLNAHPLRSKKRSDYLIWAKAVEAAAGLRRGNDEVRVANSAIYAFINQCKEQIMEGRAYAET